MMSFRWGVRAALCATGLALCASTPSRAQSAGPQAGELDVAAVRALFLANCATCHGENGDGQGATKLEKPARSFKEGGFSYGNTPEALLRTITNGIPGTPMPSFATALKESQRKELARYVISLGPPETKVSEAETILVVRDRPLFVRGKLPAIAEGAPERPRGLFVGTTDGFTFEYRVDDVRLLGVRQGGFVERTDWQDRGGSAQKPLGKLVYLFGGGNPGPTFAIPDAAGPGSTAPAASARFSATFVRAGQAWIAYVLWADTQPLRTRRAWVEESPRAHASAVGSGFARLFEVEDLGQGGRYSLCASSSKAARKVDSAAVAAAGDTSPGVDDPEAAKKDRKAISENEGYVPKKPAQAATPRAPAVEEAPGDWIALARADGGFEIELARGLKEGDALELAADEVRVEFRLDPGEKRTLEVVTLLVPAWDADVRAKWTKELQR
jgi:mono/diheme cytochrome c family protein